MRLGDDGGAPAPAQAGDDDDLISVGEDLYAIMLGVISEMPLAGQMELAGAFQRRVSFSALPSEVQELFEAVAEEFLAEDDDDSSVGDDAG